MKRVDRRPPTADRRPEKRDEGFFNTMLYALNDWELVFSFNPMRFALCDQEQTGKVNQG
jgi:hypothetical protein